MSNVGPKRTAPIVGYGAKGKTKYRNSVWECFKLVLGKLGNDKVVILPSVEGYEVKKAIAMKVPQENLVAVDRNPLVLELGVWKDTYPNVLCLAGEVGKVGPYINGKIRVANLDLCSQLSQETFEQIRDFIKTVKWSDESCLAITLAKGREATVVATLCNNLKTKPKVDCTRMQALLHLLELNSSKEIAYEVLGQGTYRAGMKTQSMSWIVLKRTEIMSKFDPDIWKRVVAKQKRIIRMIDHYHDLYSLVWDNKQKQVAIERLQWVHKTYKVRPKSAEKSMSFLYKKVEENDKKGKFVQMFERADIELTKQIYQLVLLEIKAGMKNPSLPDDMPDILYEATISHLTATLKNASHKGTVKIFESYRDKIWERVQLDVAGHIIEQTMRARVTPLF